MMIEKVPVHSDAYDIDGLFWLDEEEFYYISLIFENKRYTRKLDKKGVVSEQFISDYAWMMLDTLYEDLLLEIADEKGESI